MTSFLKRIAGHLSVEITFKQLVFLTILMTLFLVFVLPTNSYDRGYWLDWINTINFEGFASVYSNPGVNYPPLILYILSLFSGAIKFITGDGGREMLDFNIHIFKIFFLIFDIGIILTIGNAIRRQRNNVVWAFFLLFNIGFWYNTLVFGQTDSMFTGLALVAIWLAYTKRFSWSALLISLAILTKFQTILWLPVWGITVLMGLKELSKRHAFNKILNMAAVFVITSFVVFSPFILNGTLGQAVDGAYVTSTQQRYDELSVNAFNFWHIVMPADQTKISPSLNSPLGISYEVVGTLLVLQALLTVVCIYVVRSLQHGKLLKLTFSKLMLLQGLISLIVFFFSTQMHERYVHSAVIALLAYAALERKFLLGFLISLPYFLNLATVVEYGGSIIEGKYLVLQPRVIALLYLAAFLVGLVHWAGVKVRLPQRGKRLRS